MSCVTCMAVPCGARVWVERPRSVDGPLELGAAPCGFYVQYGTEARTGYRVRQRERDTTVPARSGGAGARSSKPPIAGPGPEA